MNILFLHRDFPGQFQYLALALASDPNSKVVFVTENTNVEMQGVTKLVYTPEPITSKSENPCLIFYEKVLSHAQAASKIVQQLKNEGFKPDIIYGFNFWGLAMFIKDIFPDVPLISYCEWFYNAKNSDVDFNGQEVNDNFKMLLRCNNAHMLVDLYSCDACISPTEWQKNQFPKEFHNKFKVIHDGVDTELCKPDKNAKFIIKDKNLELSSTDEVITYGTRGMEPYRGFPQFMKAAEKILKDRPNAHIIIAGSDKAYYSPSPEEGTYKDIMLKELDLDLNRIHFVGIISFVDYIHLLQISSVHVYSTYPYILSWSILNAMAIGCCLVASNTAPVVEVIKDNYNGLLFDFYNVEQLVEKIEYALNNKVEMQKIRENARQTIIDNYEIRKALPKQLEYIVSLMRKKKIKNCHMFLPHYMNS